ncbi:hypothetical protein MCOR27_007493 [Pyricularia oryzae]|uniref:Neutral ceramidase n=2 Tax=Pyricularia TaxID=48558 RepID=A0ABQ8NK14_PYRGI|nr:hypothetical protein MCOR01_007468 [Pyricularia oryzae]KAI6298223.1 hypothetical protein MCOR33_005603 [Pyricularia grisea]KAH9433900.1 hypothetical protein MCOR02_005936 [Pyricularia oryzae]KAI6251937.1 hypothetical protein MCOR19_011440 [Pyricularia oryzae]KAI6274264.1 hypothetical protein MCOR27_007493 [Pyricularia oryzae]
MDSHLEKGAVPPRGRRLRFVLLAAASFFLLSFVAIFALGDFQLAALGFQQADDTPVEEEKVERPLFTAKTRNVPTGDKYLIGVGKADITGPVVEINFAGYADSSQVGTGLRQRIYARSFIVADVANPNDRFVYIVVDTSAGDTAMRYGVLEGLKALGSEYDVYGSSNVALTGTHSHSGPGGWFNYLLPQITSLGFSKESLQAIVDGTVLSIKRAHESLAPGYLDVGTTKIQDGNAQRSLWAYLANPEEERQQYGDETTDKTMTLLRFQRESDLKNIGVLTWYPVHGTAMLQNNTHVSGDNKGVSAVMFEKAMRDQSTAAPGFVAGFSQSNVGDTTPNTLGAWCDDGSGDQCKLEDSTCADGKSQSCRGRGPLFDKLDLGVSSCYEIGRRQYAGARSLYDNFDSTSTPIVGKSVKSFHFFNDMSFFKFTKSDGTEGLACPASLGYSFAAGTTDGPGAFDFTQGDSGEPSANPIWRVVSGLLRTPTKEQAACQQPKPVLLDVGELSVPYAWSPNIVDIQMLRVGQFVIIVSPGEATTMAGRRWRAAVKKAATEQGLTPAEPIVVLGGPANTYAHYITTIEEYGRQRYEGASTLYGPNTLEAYVNLTVSNMGYLAPGSTSQPPPGPPAPDYRKNSLSFITGVVQDAPPLGRSYGQCLTQPSGSFSRGAVVKATFQGANPRNNLRLEGTFVAVEKLASDGSTWTTVRDDSDWSLVYTWRRTNWLLGYSEVDVAWETEADAEAGTYRFRYNGDSKALVGGAIRDFTGTSDSFQIG